MPRNSVHGLRGRKGSRLSRDRAGIICLVVLRVLQRDKPPRTRLYTGRTRLSASSPTTTTTSRRLPRSQSRSRDPPLSSPSWENSRCDDANSSTRESFDAVNIEVRRAERETLCKSFPGYHRSSGKSSRRIGRG